MKKEETKQNIKEVCPKCGYCPHCGRGRNIVDPYCYPLPYYPYPDYPIYPIRPWYVTTTSPLKDNTTGTYISNGDEQVTYTVS